MEPTDISSAVAAFPRNTMMNVHRNVSVQQIIDDLKKLQASETFTDVEIVCAGGGKVFLHSLVLVSCSEFLKHCIDSSAISDQRYSIILPDVSLRELHCFVDLLYGTNTVPFTLAEGLEELMDLLGISLDIPYRKDGGEQNEIQSTLEEPANQPPEMSAPFCCWHCNCICQKFEDLAEHIKVHRGEIFKKKYHKCVTCKKILPSMWKLRKHIQVKHKQETAGSRGAAGSKTMTIAKLQKRSVDHLYASRSKPALQSKQAARKDHLYSARKLSSEEEAEKEARRAQQIQMKKSDHLYSTPSSPSSPTSSSALRPRAHSVIPKSPPSAGQKNLTNDDQLLPAQTDDGTLSSSGAHSPGRRANAQSIRKLGHSYAAARPRETSTNCKEMFPCDQCDKEFPLPYRLNRHIREVHVKERRHFCRVCSKSFFKLTSKDRHELTHTEHETWKCQICGKVFRDQSSLVYHTKKQVCQRHQNTKKPP